MAFNYQKAKAAGYSDDEIQRYMTQKQNPQPTVTPPVTQPIAPAKEDPSVMGFLGNIFNDGADLVQGLTALPGVAIDIATGKRDLGETAKQVGGGIVDEYNNLLGQPYNKETGQWQGIDLRKSAQHIYDNPLDSVLDILPAAQIAGKAKALATAGKVGEAGKAAQVAGEVGNVAAKSGVVDNIISKAGKAGTVSDDVATGTKALYQNMLKFSRKGNSFEKLKPNETVGAMIKDRIWGGPDELAKTAETVTGQNGVVKNVVDNAIADVPHDVSLNKVFDTLNSSSKGVYSALDKTKIDELSMRVSELPQGKQVGSTEISKLFDFEKQLQEEATDHAIAGAKGDTAAKEFASLKFDVADSISQTIDDAVGAQGVAAYTNDPRILKYLNDNVSPEFAKKFSKATTIKELRSIQAPYVRMSKMLKLSANEPSALSGKMGILGQVPLVEPVMDAITRGPATKFATGVAVGSDMLGDVLAPVTKPLGQATGAVKNAAGATAGFVMDNKMSVGSGVGAAGVVGRQFPPADSQPVDPAGDTLPIDMQTPPLTDPTAKNMADEPMGTFSPELLQALIMEDLRRTGGKNADRLGTVYKLLNPEGTKLKASQLSELGDLESSINFMDEVGQYVKQNSEAMGPVNGRFGKANPYNTNAQGFDSEMGLVAQMVAKGMEGGKLSDQDIKRYREMLPQITDTEAVANAKIANVKRMLTLKYNTKKEYYTTNPASDVTTNTADPFSDVLAQ